MKNFIFYAGGLAILLMVASYSSAGTDSKMEAEKINDAKADRAKSSDTAAETHNAMADLKPDADFSVAAADGGMLELQLG